MKIIILILFLLLGIVMSLLINDKPDLKCKLYNYDTTIICEKADGTKILASVRGEK
jgi:hypothetical protein